MTTNYAAEQLRKTIRACGGFSNDHDYIARARPVDLINAAKEIDDLIARLAAAEGERDGAIVGLRLAAARADAALQHNQRLIDSAKKWALVRQADFDKLAAAEKLLQRCYDAGHREGWQDGETNAEVFSAVNDYLEQTK